METLLPRNRELVEDLRALTPPEGDEETLDEIYDAVEEGNDALAADPSTDAYIEADELATNYGFIVCNE